MGVPVPGSPAEGGDGPREQTEGVAGGALGSPCNHAAPMGPRLIPVPDDGDLADDDAPTAFGPEDGLAAVP
eukprot:9914728-Lingulodinium_polyedra.AAC.1